jgi:hypothetical protein
MDPVRQAIRHFTSNPAAKQPAYEDSDWQEIAGRRLIVLQNCNGILATYDLDVSHGVNRVVIPGVEYIGR